ncbi:MAG: LytTR family transcriptional regulator [Saprospiraceae bacterium]|nr:LytTR family transcriptional regulator [Candidatus Vicinibacter affinis]
MDGQQLNTRKSLKQLAEILEGTHMIQCHRSYLVNRNQIKSWNADSMKLSNGKIIPISRGKIHPGSNKLIPLDALNFPLLNQQLYWCRGCKPMIDSIAVTNRTICEIAF